MKKLLLAFLFVSGVCPWRSRAEEGYRLDRAPIDPRDLVSLQAGARTFVNYCLNCHGAQYMRYNRLTDLGLTEAQINDNLMFTADKVGDTMKVALTRKDGKEWFGVAPPDLSVVARSRGADWLYTYLRTFYRDPKRPPAGTTPCSRTSRCRTCCGSCRASAPTGRRRRKRRKRKARPTRASTATTRDAVDAAHAGTQNEVQYDTTVRDLVNFLVYMGEPARRERKRIGVVVLFVLGILFIFA